MDDSKEPLDEIFMGLRALSEASFPKKCNHCGTVYNSADEFIFATQAILGRSGLKASVDDDGEALVELYRNCHCGSTLMDFFSERRDRSEAGLQRRDKFSRLLVLLADKGLSSEVARRELKQWMRGEPCPQLARLGFK
ncbi:MAG: oxidoreductase [Motiliproteus sp.]|nr:oxidoreductase [Motiliproteus sp.]